MRLYFIRHAESENNALWRRTGSADGRSADPPITAIGHKQAQCLANFLAGSDDEPVIDLAERHHPEFGITHLYCSLMKRSVQTGQYVANALALPLIARDDIHERGGIYLQDPVTDENEGLPGPNRSHFEEHHPGVELPGHLGQDGWWNRPYEDRNQAVVRARGFLESLLAEHDGQDHVAIISHGGFLQSLYSVLFGGSEVNTSLSRPREIWVKSHNTAITRIDFWGDFIRLTYQNRIDFMPAELLT